MKKEHPVFNDEIDASKKRGFFHCKKSNCAAWEKPGFIVARKSQESDSDGRVYHAYKVVLVPKLDDKGEPVLENGEPVMVPSGNFTSVHKVPGPNGSVVAQEYATADEAMADCV